MYVRTNERAAVYIGALGGCCSIAIAFDVAVVGRGRRRHRRWICLLHKRMGFHRGTECANRMRFTFSACEQSRILEKSNFPWKIT